MRSRPRWCNGVAARMALVSNCLEGDLVAGTDQVLAAQQSCAVSRD
jgi:hypothetical protein